MSERTAPELQASAPSRGKHIPEFDVMRGAAIIFVVYLHAYFSPWEVSPRREVLAMHVINLFANTAVPVFFFISAFLLSRDSRSSFGALLGRKARRIAVPLVFWMLASLAFRVWKEGALTSGMVKSLLLFDISGQFYFVFVLLVFTVAFHFVSDWSTARLRWLAIAAFAANLATIVYYQSSSLQGDFSTLAYRNPLTWVFCFSFGFYVGRSRGTLSWTRRYLARVLLGMAALMAVYVAAGEHGDYPVSYFGVTVFLFGCLSLLAYPALVQLVTKPAAGRLAIRPLTALSSYAFAIYLVHKPFFVGTGSIADNLISADSRFNTDFFKLMNALFVVGFVSSLLFVVAMARVAPSFAAEFMGIEPRRKPT